MPCIPVFRFLTLLGNLLRNRCWVIWVWWVSLYIAHHFTRSRTHSAGKKILILSAESISVFHTNALPSLIPYLNQLWQLSRAAPGRLEWALYCTGRGHFHRWLELIASRHYHKYLAWCSIILHAIHCLHSPCLSRYFTLAYWWHFSSSARLHRHLFPPPTSSGPLISAEAKHPFFPLN